MRNYIQASLLSILIILFFNHCKNVHRATTAQMSLINELNLDSMLLQELVLQNVLGIAVGVVENGVVTQTKVYGHLDEERTQPVTINTVFRYASVSKPITALATFIAMRNSNLRLSDSVSNIVPYWPSEGEKGAITIAQLLSHRSGISDYGKERGTSNRVCQGRSRNSNAVGYFEAEKSVERFTACDLVFSPGDTKGYTTWGYDLLGAAIEESTGTDYVAFVNQHIRNIAGLSSLVPHANGARGYDYNCNMKREFVQGDPTAIKVPGGGWSSNIQDFAKLTRGFIINQFHPTTFALWQNVNFRNYPDNYKYGLIRDTINDAVFVSHSGKHNNLSSFMGFFPGDSTGVCVFVNGANGSAARIAKKIFRMKGYTHFRERNTALNNITKDTTCGDNVMGLWRRTGEADKTVLRRHMSSEELIRENSTLSGLGWSIVDIETFRNGSLRKWDAIYKKEEETTYYLPGYSKNQFEQLVINESNRGRKLIDVEVYINGTEIKWAGVFQENQNSSIEFYTHLNDNDFSSKCNELSQLGKKLIDVETYKVGLNMKWTGIWLGNGDFKYDRLNNKTEFIELCRERTIGGYRLRDIESYQKNNQRWYAGVWEVGTETERRKIGYPFSYIINTKHNEYITNGQEILDLEVLN